MMADYSLWWNLHLCPPVSSRSSALELTSSRSIPAPKRTGCLPANTLLPCPTSMTAPATSTASSASMGQRSEHLINTHRHPDILDCRLGCCVLGLWYFGFCRPLSTAPSLLTWRSPRPRTSSVSGPTVGPTPCTVWAFPPRLIWVKWEHTLMPDCSLFWFFVTAWWIL